MMDEVEKMLKWVKQIPKTELYDYIKQKLQMPDLRFNTKYLINSNTAKIVFHTSNLIDDFGCLALLYEYIGVCSHISSVHIIDDKYVFECYVKLVCGNGSEDNLDSVIFLKATYEDNIGWKYE